MSDKYYKLIYDHELYSSSIITEFGEASPHWRHETNRKRELFLRHQMVCIYLCNQETKPFLEIALSLANSLKRRRPLDEVDEALVVKKQKLSEEAAGATKIASQETLPTVVSGSSSSGEQTWKEAEGKYRFILLEGMPNAEQIQSHFSKEWGIEPPTNKWDLVDTLHKKFVEVKVSRSELARETYHKNRNLIFPNCCLVMVDPESGDCYWEDQVEAAKGEEKVKAFILKRAEAMRKLGIMSAPITEEPDFENLVFCNDQFNNMLDMWVNDWFDPRIINEMSKEIIEGDKCPMKVDADVLLEKLSDLQETERKDFIRWKGKLTPEGWVHNFLSRKSNDKDMVLEFKEKFLSTIPPDEFLEQIMSLLSGTKYNFFAQKVEGDTLIGKLLGIGLKKRVHNEGDSEARQETYKELKPLKYDYYFDEILRRLAQKHNFVQKPLIHLKEELTNSDHPVTTLSLESCARLIDMASDTNAGVYCSKITNMYSRLGGSYLVQHGKNSTHNMVAIMPIYCTLHDKNTTEKTRAVSGIILRGPHHARSPTDRINILVIEVLPQDNATNYYLKMNPPKFQYELDCGMYLTVRQNAIMKEDSSYVTFSTNSLFIPANLLGVMTVENPNIRPDQNMREMIEKTISSHGPWLMERFVEGVVVAVASNSRDEGYFSMLRKLYMLILAWRRGSYGATWDVNEFCDKVNECLVDNPISMHFHNTLLDILKEYQIIHRTMASGL